MPKHRLCPCLAHLASVPGLHSTEAWAHVAASPLCCKGSMLEATWLQWRENVPEQANEWAKVCFPDGPLLSFDYISLGLRRSKLSFKVTNLFPDPSLACAGSSAYWIGPIQSSLSPRFPRIDSTYLCHHFGAYCTYLKVLPPHLVPTVHASSRGMSPWLFTPPHYSPVVCQGDWKASPSSLPEKIERCESLWQRFSYPLGSLKLYTRLKPD